MSAASAGHDVVLLEAMPWTGGQIRLAARNPRRKDLLGIVEWRDRRAGPAGRRRALRHVRRRRTSSPTCSPTSSSSPPAVCRRIPSSRPAPIWWSSAWDVVGGDARLSGDVLLYDDDGTHSAMTTAEMLARSGARLEIVTPERTVGVDVGGLNMVPYARAFNETDTRITLNQRVRTVRRDDGRLDRRDRQRPLAGSSHTHRRRSRRRPRGAGQRRAVPRAASRARATAARSTTRPSSPAGRNRGHATARRRRLSAVPHRRCRRRSQHPRRDLRRAAAVQRPVTSRTARAVVTGASGGIGRAIVAELVRLGMSGARLGSARRLARRAARPRDRRRHRHGARRRRARHGVADADLDRDRAEHRSRRAGQQRRHHRRPAAGAPVEHRRRRRADRHQPARRGACHARGPAGDGRVATLGHIVFTGSIAGIPPDRQHRRLFGDQGSAAGLRRRAADGSARCTRCG